MKNSKTNEKQVFYFSEVNGNLVCEYDEDSTFKKDRQKITFEELEKELGHIILGILKSKDGYKLITEE
jgi:hypothetical protein